MEEFTKEVIEVEIKHLEDVTAKIERSERYEHDFDKLYELLRSEYKRTGADNPIERFASYNDNLDQTSWKQADTYKEIKKKRPVKGAPSEYRDFIKHFKWDVGEELARWQCRLNATTSS